MHTNSTQKTYLVICALVFGNAAQAQRGVGDWATGGFDAQRSFWLRADAKISPDNMRKPGFELVWKLSLSEPSRQGFLTPPVLLDFYIGYKGFRSLGFLGNSSGTVYGIDTDLGRIEWKKNLATGASAAGNSSGCPGGMTSAVARPTSIAYPPVFVPRGVGRGTPAKSGVGAPHEGAVTIKPAPATPAPPVTTPPASSTSTARRAPAPADPYRPRVQYAHALTPDGKFHSLYVSNGDEPKPAAPFLPPNANAQGLIVVENIAYVSTTNGCGGVANGVWALDLESQKVSHWKAGSSEVAGPAIGPDGTLYVTAGEELVALDERTLKPKGSHTAGKQKFTSPPVVFDFKGKDLIAASSADGRLHLFDTADLGKSLASSSNTNLAPGALASWQDSAGVRWVLGPGAGALVAWKVVEQNGAPALQPGWTSRDMISPLTPIIVNGVIFAVSSGESQRSSRAVLYALDGATGKELWSSGNTMTSSVRRNGLSAGGTRVYIATQDGTQYAFGYPIEH